MKKLILFLLISCSTFMQAQEAGTPVEGELLVRLYQDADLPKVIADLSNNTGLRIKRQLSRHLQIWQLEYNPHKIAAHEMLSQIQAHPLVWQAQLNHYMENRATVPNDPNFGQQWQYINTGTTGGTVGADIDADLAWDYATGGVTPLGDTIVVCVIDDGIDLSHQDIVPNLWKNWGEIPNNNIDDDGNGYVDDFDGWDADAGDGDVSGGFFGGGHGTPVAGIIGAKGNNGIGVAGVSWDVKLMIVVGGGDEAQAIAAYDYPLTMRKLYNQTNGQEGAYVVATNASWGINNRLESTFPLLCAFYDSLGVAGILNVAATANANTNIDVMGDLPTHCSSDYLIAVTNTNDDDAKVTQAGYGVQSIDLGAPGEGTYTTAANNSYGGFGGTSGATPHVAGAIGLFYSANCPQFASLAQVDPAGAAMQLKNWILQGVDANNDLATVTVSGGRLNLHNSIQLLLQSGCSLSGCYTPFGQQLNGVTGTSASVSWLSVPIASEGYLLRYRQQGSSNWIMATTQDTFYNFSGLTACTYYELQLASDCDTTQGSYSNSLIFKTGDCCEAPAVIDVDSVGENTILLSWGADANVNTYTIEYRLDGDTTWQQSTASSNGLLLSGLMSCSYYDLRIISSCAVNVNNEYSPILRFRTRGCGNCEDLTYCESSSSNTEYEWIEEVSVGNMNNVSGDDGGYAFFSTLNPTFYVGQKYPMSLRLAIGQGSSANWRWKVWIDLNQDGDFDDNNELIHDSNPITTMTLTYSDSLQIPSSTTLGSTRMRIAMKWGSSFYDQCSDFSYGEVEDYCITIGGSPTTVDQFNKLNVGLKVYPIPLAVNTQIDVQWPHQDAGANLQLIDMLGRVLQSQSIELTAGLNQYQLPTGELPSGVYWVLLRLKDGTMISQKVQR